MIILLLLSYSRYEIFSITWPRKINFYGITKMIPKETELLMNYGLYIKNQTILMPQIHDSFKMLFYKWNTEITN